MDDSDYAMMGEAEMAATPTSIKQAYECAEAPYWKEAVMEEMQSIQQNQVLSAPIQLPAGQKATQTRMLFVKKFNSFGNVDRYKARLVYSYLWFSNSIDWGMIYAPVIDKVLIRLFWTWCATHQFHIEQVDIKTAFLNGDCVQEIYVRLPKVLIDR